MLITLSPPRQVAEAPGAAREEPRFFLPDFEPAEVCVRIVVPGAGRVGQAIVRDLAARPHVAVTAADRDPVALERARAAGAGAALLDLEDAAAVAAQARAHDLVVGAGPAALGRQTLETVIDAGRDIVDISFLAEDPFELDAMARQRGVTAVVDAGVAPGLACIVYGRLDGGGRRVARYVCYVGGLPASPTGLFRYKAPFAPADVLELYTRPARHQEGGVLRTDPPLSRREALEVPGVGTLEAFLTDGLRTMLRETHVAEMREMTLRYPGHGEQMVLLRETGLFGTQPLDVDGVTVRPRALTARVLFPLWDFAPGEPDVTVMRVEIDVAGEDGITRHIFELPDRRGAATGISSMARTTGYTCTAIVSLIASGGYARAGVSAPEDVGREPGCCAAVLRYLNERRVILQETIQRLG